MMNFEILTKKSVLDIQEEMGVLNFESQEKALTDLWNEQNTFLNSEYFAIHFLEDKHFIDESYTLSNSITETMECLAIKDGIDIVKFENGNMGIVAYYNGHKITFEFKEISQETYFKLEENENELENIFN